MRGLALRGGIIALLLAIAFLSFSEAQSNGGNATALDPGAYLDHIKFLASDRLQGRGNGTAGLDEAARYIADRFREYGLAPSGAAGSFFQQFEISTGFRVLAGNRMIVAGPRGSADLSLDRDYYPLSIVPRPLPVGHEALRLPLIFAGYSITAPDLDYDDYAGIEVKDRAVLAFTHEPQENDAKSRFDGKSDTVHATVMQKALLAKSRGAGLLILVQDPTHPDDDARLGRFSSDPESEEFGIPVVLISRQMLKQTLALDLEILHAEIDRTGKPASQPLEGMWISLDQRFEKVRSRVNNVVAIARGRDSLLSKEAVVIGAHYDHLGLGGRHSLSPELVGQIHNGADDNASGTAAMLELARAAGAGTLKTRRTLVFVAFAGEELGLHGSAHYVNHPAVALEQTIAMLNLDMVGRPAGRILMSGLESAPDLRTYVLEAAREAGLEVQAFREGAGVGASDDSSFSNRRIPSLAFFSGFHADYHRPTDDWERIDLPGALKVVRMALTLTERLAELQSRPVFVPLATTDHAHSPASPQEKRTTSGGYGAYFGSVPDFGEGDKGVKFASIREGSPAARAGLRAGDVLTSFDGKPITNLYDFTFALRSKRPGDTVEVIVLRDGQRITATVQLGRR